MSAPRVLLHTDAPEAAIKVLAAHHPDITPEICTDFAGLPTRVAETRPEVVYTLNFGPAPFPREGLVEAQSVRWVSNSGSGVNHLRPWDPDQVTVTNSAGVAAAGMAQFAIGMMLHYGIDVPGLQMDQAGQVWRAREIGPLMGKTLTIVGLGKTGCETARLAAALGMRVLGVRARPVPTPDVAEVFGADQLHSALAEADYVLVSTPLIESTRGLFGSETFAAMKPGAVLVDVSRGGIVLADALIASLDAGHLKGAALDVFETEPLPPASPLWSRGDVLISPHCSGVYEGWEERSVSWFCDNLWRWRRGEPLKNVVDPARGY